MARCRRLLVCRYPLWALALLTAGSLGIQPLAGQDNSSPAPTVDHAVAFGVSAPLRELAKLPQPAQYGFREVNPVRLTPKRNYGTAVDPVEQRGAAPATNYSILANFLGVGNGFPGYTVADAPPDTNMAVGDWPGNEANAQVVQWVNVSYTVCNKTGTCGPAILGNTLWVAGMPGSLCAMNNSGSPIAQFDRQAHRWVLSQNVFVSPYAVCIAVSTSPDANGSYNLYQFPVPGNGFPDYPKIGVWPTTGASNVNNGYYQAMNNFGPGGSGFLGPQICAYDRAKMLAGDPSAAQICFQLTASEDSLLPGDLDSPVGPPNKPGGGPQDEFYIGSVGDVDNSHLSLYQFHADFVTPANSFVLGSPNTILQAVPTYNGSCGGGFGGTCVPSLGGSLMDSLGDRLMYRFAYWNDLLGQHWYVNGDVDASGGQIGVRWYEFQASTAGITTLTSTSLNTFQAGTYAPDSNYRWMGSVAQDEAGDILLGYSESSSTTHPAIYIAGRVATDPLNTLESELLVVQGNGSQIDNPPNWGSYSAMRLDPVDSCTFWYTTEYYMVTQTLDWSTQIASAKFANCPSTGAIPTTTQLTSSLNPSEVNQPVTFTATVTAVGELPTGNVTFTSNGNPIPECPNPVPVMQVGNGSVANCTTQSLPPGADTILACFNDPQGVFAGSCATLAQIVQDFSLSIFPGDVTVIQSFNNTNEPFFAQAISLTVQPLFGYGGTVALSCIVSPTLAGGTCVVNPPASGSLAGGNLNTSLTINAGSSTPIGSYTVTVTAQDRSGLMRFATLALTVINNASPISMPPGGANRTPVSFNGPTGTSVGNFSCPLVSGTGITGSEDLSKIGGVCTFSPGSVTLPGSVIVTISGCTVARLRTRTTILAAFWLGMPAMVLLGSAHNKKLSRKRRLHRMAILLLILALLMGVGCGGGYGQLTPTGFYSVLVQGAGADGTVYSAVVPVQVVPLSK